MGRDNVGKAPAFVDDATVAHLLRPGDVIEVIGGAFLDPPIVPPRGVAETLEAGGRRALLAGRAKVPAKELTFFKSVGHAGEDLVVTALLLARLGLPGACSLEPAREESPALARISAND